MFIENQSNIIEPQLNEGIFLTNDVSEILRLPYSKVRHWISGYWDNKFANGYTYSFGKKGNKAVNFYTLIEFYTYYQLRAKGLTAPKIQKYHSQLSKELGTRYPFARTIHTDGKHIWYEQLGELIKLDGKLQLDLKALLVPFLQKIEFGKDGLAQRYFPLENSNNIVIDPKHQFGQPTIKGRNIKTEIIKKMYEAGETTENICTLYNLEVSQVQDALSYYKKAA